MHDAKVKHNQTIVEQFSQQAVPFAKKPEHSDSMQMLIEMSGVSGDDQVLDVACGPGLVACAFAPHARQVTGIDITPAMIEQARSPPGRKTARKSYLAGGRCTAAAISRGLILGGPDPL